MIKIVDWNAVAWASLEVAVCLGVSIAGFGSKDSLYIVMVPIAVIGAVTLFQKLSGVVLDLQNDCLTFYSFWLKRTLDISTIRDANCEFGVPVSPALLIFGLFGSGSKSRRSAAQQRTYMVNMSGEFGSRQVRFSHKRWRDQFLSALRDAAPRCRITRWR